jgi:hypothetical protein
MGKFDSRVDKGVLVGYSSTSKSYKYYNLRLNKVVESIDVTIDETCIPLSKGRRKQINGANFRRRRSIIGR